MRDLMLLTSGILFTAILVGIALVVADKPIIGDLQTGIWILVVAVPGFFLTYSYGNKVEVRNAISDQNYNEARFRYLQERFKSPDFSLVVHGSMRIGLFLSFVVIGVLMVFIGLISPDTRGSIGFVIAGVLFLVGGLLPIILALPTIGKPLVTISRQGFESSMYGMIAWESVAAVYSSVYQTRTTRFQSVNFVVPELSKLIKQCAWPVRFLAMLLPHHKLNQCSVQMNQSSEPSEVVCLLSRHLLMQQTGRAYRWDRWKSYKSNMALIKAEELFRSGVGENELKDPNSPGAKILLEAADALEKDTQSLHRFGLFLKWLGWIAIVVFVLYLVTVLLPHFS